MRERSALGIDIFLIAATVALLAVGVLFIYSSGVTNTGVSFSQEWIRQLIWAALGMIVLVAVAIMDYARLRDLAVYLWVGLLAVLVVTLLFGRVVNGARSWIGVGDLGVQPSEFMKIVTILFLASHLDRSRRSIQDPIGFATSLGIAMIPMILILLQPDLGTALVYVPIFLFMAFAAGARPSYLIFILVTAVLLVIFTVLPAWEEIIAQRDIEVVNVLTDTRLFAYVLLAIGLIGILGIVGVFLLKRPWFRWITFTSGMLMLSLLGSVAGRKVLKDYQLMRLIVFLNPNVDPRGAGWNIIQSVTAVGSGGISGKGWLQGTQSHLQYLPQQSTDFIFSILAEEWGFVGALVVFSCFAVIIARGIIIAGKAKDSFAAYTAIGVVAMIFFHVAVNVGMAIGIMPITGIPLVLIS
ncbi:MAG: rod shape-determining protein RodA, partial [Spirochaetales bacterium]